MGGGANSVGNEEGGANDTGGDGGGATGGAVDGNGDVKGRGATFGGNKVAADSGGA